MVSVMFWNLNGNRSVDQSESMGIRIARLTRHLNVDVFVFAESRFPPAELLTIMNGVESGGYWHSHSESRLQLFTRLAPGSVTPEFDSVDGRLAIHQIILPRRAMLLAAIHMPSQMHASEKAASNSFQATTVRNDIASVEKRKNNYHTIVIGDMNMNPFDDGMVAAQGFHAVMSARIAESTERTVSGVPYRYFYNPMWGLYGDRTPGPPGTYHYMSSSPIEYHWHMVDQVLLRPGLIRMIKEIKILDNDGEETLLNRTGRPNKATASDHLPILLRLDPNAVEET